MCSSSLAPRRGWLAAPTSGAVARGGPRARTRLLSPRPALKRVPKLRPALKWAPMSPRPPRKRAPIARGAASNRSPGVASEVRSAAPPRFVIIAPVRFLRMKPGHGEVLIAEGDVEVAQEHEALVEAFRAQLDAGMWAAVPLAAAGGRREAQMVSRFDDIPRDAERVIFFPRAA